MEALASLSEHVRLFSLGGSAVACAWLGAVPAFALADGQVVFAEGEGRRVALFKDAALLVAATDGRLLVAGGDDGRVMWVAEDGEAGEEASVPGSWIDALALAASGAIAWSAGKTVFARDREGVLKSWTAPSSVRGLAFLPKGYRLAISHYNGVSLWFPNAAAAPERFEWKGSHLEVSVSPDSRFLITAMQETMLHGWRIADKAHMRMSGYAAKPRSLSWSADGAWLATSGADAAIIWPFQGKDGPMGKTPRECGVRSSRVARVAFHPKALVLAIGYEDGCVLLCRLTDGAELLVRAPTGAPLAGLAWREDGTHLAFADSEGEAGVLNLPRS